MAQTNFFVSVALVLSLSLFASPGASVTDIEEGLVGHWRLDDGMYDPGSTIALDSVGDHHGTLVNGPLWADGALEFGGGLSFDGTDDYVAIPHSADLTFTVSDSYTVAAWVNVTSLPGHWAGIVNKSRDISPWYGLWINPSNQWVAGDVNITGSTVTLGWHHLALVQDGAANTRTVYVDGQVDITGSAIDANGTGDLWFGGAKSVTEYLEGVIDDVRIYNRPLSEEEVVKLTEWTGKTGAYAGRDKRVYGGETVPLTGSGPGDATSFSWKQTGDPGDPRVTFDPTPPNQAEVSFVAPVTATGTILTFELTVVSPSMGTTTDEVDVAVIPPVPPPIPVSNVRIYPKDKGLLVVWDPVMEAETYDVDLELTPGFWFTYGSDLTETMFEVGKQPLGKEYGVKVVAKNSKSTPDNRGAESPPQYYTIMRNLSLPAPDGSTPPLEYIYAVSHFAITGMNNGEYNDNNDSWYNNEYKPADYWGYTWPDSLWFDHIVYITGDVFFDGGWWLDLTVEYTTDGSTWEEIPNVQIVPEYSFVDGPGLHEPFARYDITFATVRGTGIRIFGTPGGWVTFTSIAELEVYGDQQRGDFLVQGMDAEFPERGTATLDGSCSISNRGAVGNFLWEVVTAPVPVTLQDANSAIARFDAPGVDDDTVFVFKLTASDPAETLSDEDVRITIKNVLTTAVAGPDQTVGEGVEVALDGRGSQSTSETISYQWTAPAGITLDDPTSPTPTFTTPAIWNFTETLTFQLEVSDGVDSSTDEVNVIVRNPVFELIPLARYYWTDVLHLGQTPADRFLSPLDLSLDTNDYLATWGGQANVNPMAGDAYDFTGTGITTTVNPMIWTPLHRDNGFFGWDGRAETNLDYFGQMYHIYIFSPEERLARVRARFDDEMRIWNNGTIAMSRNSWDTGSEQYQNFTLFEGVNSMMMRFEEGSGGNLIGARITDRNDVPYDDLSYALSVPVPLPRAYAVRELPASYVAGATLDVKLSIRADPQNLPTSIQIRDSIPAGTDVADLGGGVRIGNEIAWTLTGGDVGIATRSYSLTVLSGTTGGLNFTGNVSYTGVPTQDIFGDKLVYELPSAPKNVGVEILIAGHLSWSANTEEGVVGYRIYSSVDGEDWLEIGFVTGTSYTDESVVEGSSYIYKVAAVNQGGAEGDASDPTPPASITMLIRQAEDFNYGGGLYPGPGPADVPAVEATATDDLVAGKDYFFQDTTYPDKPNVYRPKDDIDCREINPGQFIMGYTSVGDWWRYTFEVPPKGPDDPEGGWVKIVVKVASPGGGTVEVYWDEELKGSVDFVTGSWGTYDHFPMEEQFQTTPGIHTLRVLKTAGELDFDTIGIGFNWTPPRREALFEEDFEDWTNLYSNIDAINEGWSVENGSDYPNAAWRLWNTTGDLLRETDPDIGAMTNNYMITDSDLEGSAEMNEGLITPDIDATEHTKLRLTFSKNYRIYLEDTGRTQTAEVDIRTKDPVTQMYSGWTNLLHWDILDAVEYNMDPEVLDISAFDNKIIQIRWHYYDAQFDYWFAIDDIVVSGEKPVTPPPQALVRTMAIVAGNLELSWSDFADTYYIECTDDLVSGDWSHVEGPITETSWSGDVSAVCPGDVVYVRVRGE